MIDFILAIIFFIIYKYYFSISQILSSILFLRL